MPSLEASLIFALRFFEPSYILLTSWPLCASNIKHEGQIRLELGMNVPETYSTITLKQTIMQSTDSNIY